MGVINLRLPTFESDEEYRGTVRIQRVGRLLGEIELALAYRLNLAEPCRLGRSQRRGYGGQPRRRFGGIGAGDDGCQGGGGIVFSGRTGVHCGGDQSGRCSGRRSSIYEADPTARRNEHVSLPEDAIGDRKSG